jgi:3-isopropylmalate/(R)-2-methylmalate dehydratase small subunit
MLIKGKVWKFGDDVDTDGIAPTIDGSDSAQVQAQHCMEGADPDFPKKAKPGDIIVAGKNFGCGSSRERAPACIKDFGITAVIAPNYARIFARNAINIGLPILECDAAPEVIAEGDIVEIDLDTGRITNLTSGRVAQAAEFPPFLRAIIAAGGLVNYARARLGKG